MSAFAAADIEPLANSGNQSGVYTEFCFLGILDPQLIDWRVMKARSSMTIYVDVAIWHWRGLKWCHLLADDADELHRFAASLGIKRTSFQSPPKVRAAHYDLTGYERLRAIAMGAVPCDGHQIVAVLRRI